MTANAFYFLRYFIMRYFRACLAAARGSSVATVSQHWETDTGVMGVMTVFQHWDDTDIYSINFSYLDKMD